MLVAAPERWDEACFAVPALRAMISSGLGVGILCKENQRGFWETVDGLEVLDFPLKASAKTIAERIDGGWQASLAWQPDLLAEAFQKAGIPRRLGHRDKRMLKRLTHPLSVAVSPLEHRVRWYLATVEELGITTAKPEFFMPVDLGIDPEPRAVLLCPGSDFGPSHEWELVRWIELGEWLLENGKRVTVAGVDGGRNLGKPLADHLGDRVEFFHASPLDAAMPLLSVHALVIAADGSLPHLAAHVGATCVTLFGPNDPGWKRPLGKRHAVVRRHVECAPCLQPKCALDRRCQLELEAAQVIRAAAEKL